MKTTPVQKVMCLAFCLEKLKRFNCPNAPTGARGTGGSNFIKQTHYYKGVYL